MGIPSSKNAGYTQVIYPMPVCNHTTTEADEHNIGYIQGITDDGIPFEAEMWTDERNYRNLTVYIPEFMSGITGCDSSEEGDITVSSEVVQSYDVLGIGMVESDTVLDETTEHEYVTYLIEKGIVRFTTNVFNSSHLCLIDMDGNDVVCLNILLENEEGICAETDLQFLPFPNGHKKAHIKRIK